MNAAQTETRFRDLWERTWHGPDHQAALDEGLSEDFQMHISSLPEPIPKADWMGFVAAWHRAFPDGRMDIQDLWARDDQVWVYWISTGTHQAEYLGVPASGHKVAYWGMELYRFAGHRLAHCLAVPDALSLFRQMGGA